MSAEARVITFTAGESENGHTVGEMLKHRGVSRSMVTKLKRVPEGITLGGAHIRTCDRVKTGDTVAIALSDERFLEPAKGMSVPVLYEDEDVVVFDKPVNMPVHPSHKHRDDTLGNCFAAMYPFLTFRPVNRLDRNTSGLCAVAKNPHAAGMLQNSIRKVYFAAVCGTLTEGGIIDAPIGRADGSIIRREVRADGRPAVTEHTILKSCGKYTLVRVTLRTGRTHQIRVHFAYIGHPLAGDDLYGGDTSDIKEQALHCGEVEFISPVSKKEVKVVSPIREDIARLFENAESE